MIPLTRLGASGGILLLSLLLAFPIERANAASTRQTSFDTLGIALVLKHPDVENQDNLLKIEASFRNLGFRVLNIDITGRAKTLAAIQSVANKIPTNALLAVYYQGPMVMGEQKIQSQYSDAAFLIPSGFAFKNKKEIRSKCIGLYDLDRMFSEAGCRHALFFADPVRTVSDNNVFESLQSISHIGQMTDEGSFYVIGKSNQPSVQEQLVQIGQRADMEEFVQLPRRLAKTYLSTPWDRASFFGGNPVRLLKWNYFDSQIDPGTEPGEVRVNSIGQVFCWIPAGSGQLGSPESEPNRHDDETQMAIRVKNGFWISKYEVTEREYFRATKRRSRTPTGKNFPYADSRHGDAKRMADSLNKLESNPGWSYALPAESLWEYACRAGSNTAYQFGNDPGELANFGNFADQSLFQFDSSTFRYADRKQDDGFAKTAQVGSYQPNAWGVHDMHGNVWEWCAETYYPKMILDGVQPKEKPVNELGRVIRGGSWISHAHYCRSAMRNAQHDLNGASHIGLRLLLSPR